MRAPAEIVVEIVVEIDRPAAPGQNGRMDSHAHAPATPLPPAEPASPGRQLADAVCVAVLALILTFAANAIAHVSANTGAMRAGVVPGSADCMAPVDAHGAPVKATTGPLAGMALAAECDGDKAAPAAPAPAH
jgi:hypothetical protein